MIPHDLSLLPAQLCDEPTDAQNFESHMQTAGCKSSYDTAGVQALFNGELAQVWIAGYNHLKEQFEAM
jgi:hypothetical protein